jgi:TetR/AcrR family transcriptional regulator
MCHVPEQSRRRPGRPGAGEAIASEDAILAEGLAAFGELGYDGVTVRDLAARLGVSHNFINDRYGSKEAFWRAVVDLAQEQLWARLREAMEQPGRAESDRFEDTIRAFYAVNAERPGLARIMNYEAGRDTPRLRYVLERHVAPMLAEIAPRVAQLAEQGMIRDLPFDAVLFAIVALTQASSQQPLLRLLGDNFERDPVRFTRSLGDIVLYGLVAGARQP